MNKIRYLYMLISAIAVIIIITGLVAVFQSPYTGLGFAMHDNKWYVSSIDPDSPASAYPNILHQEVVSIGAQQIGDYDLSNDLDSIPKWQDIQEYWSARFYLRQYTKIGSPTEITLVENDKKTTVRITPTYFPLSVILSKIFISLIIGIFFLFMGLLIIIKKRKELYAKLLFWTFTLGGTMQILMGLVYISDISIDTYFLQFVYIANAFENIFATAFTLHFLTIFPRDSYNISSRKWIPIVFYGLTLFIYIIYVFRIFNLAFPLFMVFSILTAIYFMVYNYIHSNSIEKAQIRWLYIGVGLFIIVVLLLIFLPNLLIQKQFVTEQTGSLFTVLFPLSILFSIIRYRLMDISSLFDNTLVYVISLGGLAFIDITVVSTFIKMGILTATTTPIAIAVSVWVIALIYMWVRNRLHHLVQVLLRREIYNTNDISLSLSRSLFLAHSINEAFAVTDAEIKKALHPKSTSAYILYNGTETPLWEGVVRNNIPILASQAINLKTSNNIYLLVGESETLPDNYAGGAIMPIVGQTGLLGYIFIQDKQSGRLYDSEDIKLFNVLSNQLAMSIEAINAREETKRKEMESILEKERISREIHDGIGSRFVEASMLSDQIVREADNADKIIGYGKNMKNILLDGLSDLRELIWAVEPGPSNLNAIVSHVNDKIKNLSERDGFKVTSEIHIENEDAPIPAIMKLNLIRIIQETLTNTIKHAKATQVYLSMIQKGDNLTIRIKDNGMGFDAKKLGTAGHGVRNIKKRCADIGAALDIESAPAQGTSITISLTLKPD